MSETTNNTKELMRKVIEAKKAKSSDQRGLGRADKDIQAKRMKVTKQHKKGGLFDGK